MRLHFLPNVITVLRILLVGPVAWFLMTQRYAEALLLFILAGVSDAVDGYLAKHFSWQSRLGSILDPLADKLLLVTTYVALAWLGVLPVWLTVAVVARDVVVVGGAVAFHWLVGHYEMSPSFVSKLNTVAQIVLAVVAVASLVFPSIPAELLQGLIVLAFATTLLSGADYVWTWGSRAYRSAPPRGAKKNH